MVRKNKKKNIAYSLNPKKFQKNYKKNKIT